MAVTVSGTSITFNDATVQTTKAQVISGTAYSGYTAYYTGYGMYESVGLGNAITNLGGNDLLCAIEIGFGNTVTTSDGSFVGYGSARARRKYRTVT